MRFLDGFFPLVVCVVGQRLDAKEVREMSDGFESYFERGERYAVLIVPGAETAMPGAAERKLITTWADHPRTMEMSRRLCVGTVVLVENILVRAALTALMAFRDHASRVESVATIDKGIEYCLGRIKEAGLQLDKPPDLVRYELSRLVEQAR
jgi:hypothetical protein